MSLRPIDMQTILPRVQNINSARETVVHKQDNMLHQEQIKTVEQAEREGQRVSSSHQKEEEKIKDDRDATNSSGNKKKKKQDKKDKEKKHKKTDKLQSLDYHIFDMKV